MYYQNQTFEQLHMSGFKEVSTNCWNKACRFSKSPITSAKHVAKGGRFTLHVEDSSPAQAMWEYMALKAVGRWKMKTHINMLQSEIFMGL